MDSLDFWQKVRGEYVVDQFWDLDESAIYFRVDVLGLDICFKVVMGHLFDPLAFFLKHPRDQRLMKV